MSWLFYIAFVLVLADQVARQFNKYFFTIFLFTVVLFLTPAQIDLSAKEFAPSLFTFFFNVLFEGNYSTRVLRPLFLSIPFTIVLLSLYYLTKKRFF